jgi:hypothetical protein
MKKSDTNAVELAKPELEAPVQLTPEQLEIVAAGFRAALVASDLVKNITILTGSYPGPIVMKGMGGAAY